MIIKDFRDINAWQEGIKLAKEIYLLTEKYPPSEKYNLTKHLRESSRGTAANIAEGFGRYYYREKLQFYGIARGCLNEVLSDIKLSCEIQYIDKPTHDNLIYKIETVGRMLNTLITNTARMVE